MKHFKHNTVAIIFILSMTFGTITPVVANAAWWNPVDWFSFVVHIFSPSKKPAETTTSGPKSQPASTPAPESAENPTYRVSTTSRGSSSGSSSSSNGSGGMQNDVPTPVVTGGASTSPAHQNCPTTYQPVCGVDGMTYQNMCELQKAGIEYFYGSACTPAASSAHSSSGTQNDTPTPTVGTTTNNTSSSGNVNDTAVGSGVVCASNYAPVCGTNGVTYSNYCELQKAHATYFTGSACPIPAATSSSGTNGGGSTGNSSGSTGTTPTATTTPAPTPTPATTFKCGLRATPSQSVNLTIRPGSTYYRPTPATTGTDIKFWTSVYNIGPDDMGEYLSENVGSGIRCFSTLYLRIDANNDGAYDVLLKSSQSQLRATDSNWVEHSSLKSFPNWKAVAGTHNWQICADGEGLIDENNETDNCVNGTISVQ
jgi:hypothetical protein